MHRSALDVLNEGDIADKHRPLAQLITALENDKVDPALRAEIQDTAKTIKPQPSASPVLVVQVNLL